MKDSQVAVAAKAVQAAKVAQAAKAVKAAKFIKKSELLTGRDSHRGWGILRENSGTTRWRSGA